METEKQKIKKCIKAYTTEEAREVFIKVSESFKRAGKLLRELSAHQLTN